MSADKLSRRDFLKIAGAAGASGLGLVIAATNPVVREGLKSLLRKEQKYVSSDTGLLISNESTLTSSQKLAELNADYVQGTKFPYDTKSSHQVFGPGEHTTVFGTPTPVGNTKDLCWANTACDPGYTCEGVVVQGPGQVGTCVKK